MKKIIIEEWQQKTKSVISVVIRCILRNYADTPMVRIRIIQDQLRDDNVLQAIVNTYDDVEQNFKFYIRNFEDTTEICVYEEYMSNKNARKIMIIVEKDIMTSLDQKKIEGYEDSIVAFILANIEWN